MAATASERVAGEEALDSFANAIPEAPPERRAALTQLTDWARGLVSSGDATATATLNPGYRTWTLRLVPHGETAALATIWIDHSVVALSIEATVFERVAPEVVARAQSHLGAEALGRGKNLHEWDQPLLRILEQAFKQARRGARAESQASPDGLQPNRTYSWAEVADAFGFRPRYFSVGGGMLAVKQHNAVVLVTHPGGGRSFDYGDRWEGADLITGKGLDGPQRLERENLDVAENRRSLFVFEHGGPETLTYRGRAQMRGLVARPRSGPQRRSTARLPVPPFLREPRTSSRAHVLASTIYDGSPFASRKTI